MEKQWFKQEADRIDVPKDEVMTAISKGMALGRKAKHKKTKRKITTIAGTSAAALIIASGFIFTPVNRVFAEVPVIGAIYEKLNLGIGKDLYSQALVKELNETATDNGISVTLTSAYYDGNILGVTFKAEGKDLALMNRGNSPEAGYGHFLFDGSEKKQWAASMTKLKKLKDGWIGAIEFEYPNQTLPEHFTLPITFTSMGDTKGTWKFDVPVKQIPNKNIAVNSQSTTNDHSYTLKVDHITVGKATTLIDYETNRPKIGSYDQINLKVYDDLGNRLDLHHAGPLTQQPAENDNKGNVTIQERASFGKVDKHAKYLMLYPEISKDEFSIRRPIRRTPFEVESKRFGYKMIVDRVKKEGNQLILDYHIKNVNPKKSNLTLLQNFADQISLIRTEDVIDTNNGQAQYEVLQDDSLIYGMHGEVLNRESLSFETRFTLEHPETFKINDYSLMVPFGIFGMNEGPVKMAPIKINLK